MCRIAIFLLMLLMVQACSVERLYQMKMIQKRQDFQQMDFKSLANMYMTKYNSNELTLEGIYSVSALIEKKNKGFLSSEEKEKILDRKENYSTVAIFRNNEKPGRDFFEVSLNKDLQISYPVSGEFSKASEGNIFVYKHFEPKQKTVTYTFTSDASYSILEGIRTENNGSATITYKLTYIKLQPKSNTSNH